MVSVEEVNNTLSDVDVIVVTHKSSPIIWACLASIAASCGVDRPASVTVVESSDTQHSLDSIDAQATKAEIARWNATDTRFGTVRFIELGVNAGFGSAANRGAACTSASFLAVLNPDIDMHANCLQALRGGLVADRHLAAVGPSVLNPDETLYPSARTFPNLIDAAGHAFVGSLTPHNPWTRRYIGTAQNTEWISGTAMMIRRADFQAVGGFDESYFMYVEDVDLCWRWANTGRKVARIDGARLVHTIGASSQQVPIRMIVAHHRSLWRFVLRKTRGRDRLALPVIATGLCARVLLLIGLHGINRRPSATLHRNDRSRH